MFVCMYAFNFNSINFDWYLIFHTYIILIYAKLECLMNIMFQLVSSNKLMHNFNWYFIKGEKTHILSFNWYFVYSRFPLPYFIHKGGEEFMFMHICFVLQIGEKVFYEFYV